MSDYVLTIDESWRHGRENFARRASSSPVRPQLAEELSARGVSARGFGLLDQVNKYVRMKEEIKNVARDMALRETLAQVERQLAPNQRVVVTIDPESGAIRSIERPGKGYLEDPRTRSHFTVEAGDDDTCWAQAREVSTFTVRDAGGRRRTLGLDDGASRDAARREGEPRWRNDRDQRRERPARPHRDEWLP